MSDKPPERDAATNPARGIPASGADTSPLLLDSAEASLLELVDNLLNRGVVLDAELVLGLAGVDLIYVHLNALLCAADRVLSRGNEPSR